MYSCISTGLFNILGVIRSENWCVKDVLFSFGIIIKYNIKLHEIVYNSHER